MSAGDEWAGEGVTPFRPSDTFPLKGEGLRCEGFLLRRAIPNADGIARLDTLYASEWAIKSRLRYGKK